MNDISSEQMNANSAPPASSGEAADLETQLGKAVSEAAASREAQLRAVAELENVRRRAQREIDNARAFALERIANDLLAVRDSLELAVHSAPNADVEVLRSGQQATLQLLNTVFERYAVKQINPAGGAFDPNLHEAVAVHATAELPAGQVYQVLQAGYQLNGRLLRPARVVVAREPQDPSQAAPQA